MPAPPRRWPPLGHLPDWGGHPLELLEAGARLGPLFELNLGLRTVVGYSPGFNRRLLSDLSAFRSAGSFSRLVPYLAGGVILTDAPAHRERRATLNPSFHARSLEALRQRVRAAIRPVRGEFDALAWADTNVRRMLNAAFFSGEFEDALLHAYLAPLRRPFPLPMLPRPAVFARFRAELRRLGALRRVRGGDDLLAQLCRLEGGLEETRIALGAAHDTTTHTLAWTLWHLAAYPQWRHPEGLGPVIRETLRLFPPGWMGSRRLARDLEVDGCALPRGTLVMYSPYLTHRDPSLWPEPLAFRPQRFLHKPPAWAYLPFGGGERTCLGMHLAQLLLEEALSGFLDGTLRPCGGDPRPRPGVTLGPAGPLHLSFWP
nr:cytochrome P450 [Deinobacterium chartae]